MGKSNTDKECTQCGRVGHIRADCRDKTHVNGEDLRNLRPREKVLEIVRKKSTNHRKMCHWALLIWVLFEVLSDHGETIEDDVVVDESSDEPTGTMPPLPLVSWFKEGSKTWQWQRLPRRRRVLSSFFDC